MWHDFAIACCLVLVIEGNMPFLSPSAWRSMLLAVAQIDDRRLRIAGLCAMLCGTVLLYLIN